MSGFHPPRGRLQSPLHCPRPRHPPPGLPSFRRTRQPLLSLTARAGDLNSAPASALCRAIGSRRAGPRPAVGGHWRPSANHRRGGAWPARVGRRWRTAARRSGPEGRRWDRDRHRAGAPSPGAAPAGSPLLTAAASRSPRRGRWTGGAGSRRVRPGPGRGRGRAKRRAAAGSAGREEPAPARLAGPGRAQSAGPFCPAGKAERKKWREMKLLRKLEKQRERERAEKQAEEQEERREDRGDAAGSRWGGRGEKPGENWAVSCHAAALARPQPVRRPPLHAERGPAGLHPEQRPVAGAAHVPRRTDRPGLCHLLRGRDRGV